MANTGYIKFNTKDITSVIQEETADKVSVNPQNLTEEQKKCRTELGRNVLAFDWRNSYRPCTL